MADKSTHNSTLEELEIYFNEDDSRQTLGSRNETPSGNVNESASSTVTTPDPLNTAFMNETIVSEAHSQHTLSQQQQSQTTNEASLIVHVLIDRISQQDQEVIDVGTPTRTATTSTSTMPKTPAMKSMGTMPMTPTMISTGTMPTTPVIKSTGTMPQSPQVKSTGTMSMTPTMRSTGTMPRTPTMKSIGTMPMTPTMISTGTMPRTPTTTASPSAIITIDLRSATPSTIDLCSPDTPTNTDSPQ